MRKKLEDAVEDVLAGTITIIHLFRLVKHAPTVVLKMRRAHIGHILMAKGLAGLNTDKEAAYMQVTDHLLYHWGTFTWPQIEAPVKSR